jgi:chitin synthase
VSKRFWPFAAGCPGLNLPRPVCLAGGTKGSDTVETDLGSVKGTTGGRGEVEVELLADQKDVDAAYNDALDNLRIRKPLTKPMGLTASQLEQRQKDYYVRRCLTRVAEGELKADVSGDLVLPG